MFPNIPIRLNILNSGDLVSFFRALHFFIFFSALLSGHPVALAIAAFFLCAVLWTPRILGFSKANNIKLTSVIFADGRVKLESGQEAKLEGSLIGQQWCTRWLTVLRVSDGKSIRNLLVTPARQCDAGDFRRLNMWLRQGSAKDSVKGSC
jgi:hypothetical protein